jgi:phosphoribosylformylglycinamidine (FGAM) synthase-like amidotransferase family enzyme
MGMMPHPERFVQIEQHGNFRRPGFDIPPHGLTLLRGVVAYAASC